MKQVDWSTVQVENVNTRDYPDFVDAYFSYGEYTDGTALTEDELIKLTEENGDALNEKAHESLF